MNAQNQKEETLYTRRWILSILSERVADKKRLGTNTKKPIVRVWVRNQAFELQEAAQAVLRLRDTIAKVEGEEWRKCDEERSVRGENESTSGIINAAFRGDDLFPGVWSVDGVREYFMDRGGDVRVYGNIDQDTMIKVKRSNVFRGYGVAK